MTEEEVRAILFDEFPSLKFHQEDVVSGYIWGVINVMADVPKQESNSTLEVEILNSYGLFSKEFDSAATLRSACAEAKEYVYRRLDEVLSHIKQEKA